MLSRMMPAYYLSNEIFRREQEGIFKRLWIFYGLKTMLAEHNAFIARTMSGVPVVVQNFNGELRAFENSCAHRQNALQWDEFGKRPLLCRYHGWGYDADGYARNIPSQEEIYRFGDPEREGLRLRRYGLEVIGNLVFINLSATPLPITEQFTGEFIDSLRDSSNAYDAEVLIAKVKTRFNWKLAYENLRDGNHPRYVHPQTLAKYVDFHAVIDQKEHWRATAICEDTSIVERTRQMQYLRGFSFGGIDTALKELKPLEWHGTVERFGSADAYYNWLAYPNLHIASGSGGYSFTLEQHTPVAPGETDLTVYWLTAKKKRPYPAMPAVLLASLQGGFQVLREDISVMEMVQSTLHADAPSPRQGAYEYLNKLVEKWYKDLMDGQFEI
ncbi:MAG: aromatic ring-hydroxylating oxygenase subunit alpha [Burkholderiales bacterium]